LKFVLVCRDESCKVAWAVINIFKHLVCTANVISIYNAGSKKKKVGTLCKMSLKQNAVMYKMHRPMFHSQLNIGGLSDVKVKHSTVT